MTKPRTKTKAIWMPGKERPAASRLGIQGPPTPELHQKNLAKNTRPFARQPIRRVVKGLDYRFLRSQPRVIGPGSLRRARPRQSDYNTNTQPKGLIINAPLSALQIYTSAR